MDQIIDFITAARLRTLAHEKQDVRDLKAALLHMADQLDQTREGRPCDYCQLQMGIAKLRSSGPAPCCMAL
jgi:hypothetical protein